jgi:ribosomal protein L37AE/L43A
MLERERGHEELADVIARALTLARSGPPTPETIESLGAALSRSRCCVRRQLTNALPPELLMLFFYLSGRLSIARYVVVAREETLLPRPDFPKTLVEFQARFSTEDACRRYLMESRWPDAYRCPRCQRAEAYGVVCETLLQCRACRYQVSVTAGTVMHGTRVSLRDWFWAAYLVTAHTPGFSAVQLQRQLGLGRC